MSSRRHEQRRVEAIGSLQRFWGMGERVEDLYGERARAIREAHAAGATISEIADAIGVARKVVYDAIRNGKGGR